MKNEKQLLDSFALQISRELGALTNAVQETKETVIEHHILQQQQNKALWAKHDNMEKRLNGVEKQHAEFRRDMKWYVIIGAGIIASLKFLFSKLMLFLR